MILSIYLSNRIREVYLTGRWIANTNIQEQINNLPVNRATEQIQGMNSIAMLTFHLNYYLEGLLQAFETGRLDIRDQYSFNLPPVRQESDWTNLSSTCLRNARIFADYIEKMEEAQLDEPFIDEQYGTVLRNIEAVIEHSYYHLGQMVLIRKWIESSQD